MACRARAVDPALKVASIRHEGERDLRGQGVDGRLGEGLAHAQPADNDRDGRRAGIAFKGPCIGRRGPSAIRGYHRKRTARTGLVEPFQWRLERSGGGQCTGRIAARRGLHLAAQRVLGVTHTGKGQTVFIWALLENDRPGRFGRCNLDRVCRAFGQLQRGAGR